MSRIWKSRPRSAPYIFALAIVVSACGYFSNANSQPQPAPPTVSTPPVKSTQQAAQDLKRELPLDPAKLGEPLPRNLFVELSKLINPTVVSITTSTAPHQSRSRYRDPLQEFLEDFWGGRGGPPGFNGGGRSQPMVALGTGFLIREDGLIVTNSHVVSEADIIKVQLDVNSPTFYEAEVIGKDSQTDIALIKIDAKKPLPYARLGSSRDVQVGEWVAAFGNPYGHAHTMTKGIVSAIGREIAELNRFPFIQTDASINPGNSGGPLVNTQGLVIGVNTAIDARAQGIGFAIPIDNVKQVISQLEKEGRVHRGWMGVGINAISDQLAGSLGMDESQGVVVTTIYPGSPAEKSGLRIYDLIMEINGKKVDSPASLTNLVAATEIGSTAKVKVWRFSDSGRHRELTLNVKISDSPDEGRRANKAKKQYFGQKAPFDLGFKVADFAQSLADEFGVPPGGPKGPLVIEVTQGSAADEAGFQAGDVIVDVNRLPVDKATDVVKQLHKDRNIVRIIRGNTILIVTLGH